jgi:hypothetical protein
MAFSEHLTQFIGKPVISWERSAALEDPAGTIYRIAIDWGAIDEGFQWTDKFAEFLEQPGVSQIPALVVGLWSPTSDNSSAPVVQALVAARKQLPALRAICLGDVIYEECEISWLEQSDISPLFNAFPELEVLHVRGGNRLSLGTLRNAEHLKTLIVEAGGLPVRVVREVMSAHLPALEHLKLFLGTPDYGGDTTAADLAPLLAGDLFPKLKYLGLCNSEIADEIARAAAQTPILERIEVLDLSMGTLTDEGARALLDSPSVRKLKKLDIHFHYCSEAMVKKLQALPIEIDASDSQQSNSYNGNEYRYVAVSE